MNPNKVLELADHFCQQLEEDSEEYELWSQDILEKKNTEYTVWKMSYLALYVASQDSYSNK